MKHIIFMVPFLFMVLFSFAQTQPTTVTDMDGNRYATVKIGSQTWMAGNLNVAHFRNGDIIPEIEVAAGWVQAAEDHKPAWCYYNGDAANGRKYGKLYNWYAVHDPRGLAPEGWHIPSDAAWTELTIYLGGENVAGTKLKFTSGWHKNGNGSNESGFAGMAAGFDDGTFYGIDLYGYWWSSSETDINDAWYRYLYCFKDRIYRGDYDKGYGLSVRCLMD